MKFHKLEKFPKTSTKSSLTPSLLKAQSTEIVSTEINRVVEQ